MSKIGNEIVDLAINLQKKLQEYNKDKRQDVLVLIASVKNETHLSVVYGENAAGDMYLIKKLKNERKHN